MHRSQLASAPQSPPAWHFCPRATRKVQPGTTPEQLAEMDQFLNSVQIS